MLFNGLLGIRIWYLPKPDPPPVWFERYVIWGWFAVAGVCGFSAPGLVVVLTWPLSDTTGFMLLGAGIVFSAWAVGLPDRRLAVRSVEIPIDDLPDDLDGIRLAQLTDLHVGPMVSERRALRWVQRVNEDAPDYVLLTGDLIASGTGFLPALERVLSQLRPRIATIAVMGNHDYFGRAGEPMVALHHRLGHWLLRNDARCSHHNGTPLWFAGVDDTWSGRSDVHKAFQSVPEDAHPVVMVAHDPEVFEAAADAGATLQVSGHIHGGQIAIPGLGRRGSVLRPFGVRWISGLYRHGSAQLWLGSGLGTTGAPIRIGVPSELPVLTLRRPQDPEHRTPNTGPRRGKCTEPLMKPDHIESASTTDNSL